MSVILAVEAGGDTFSAALIIKNETRKLTAAAVPHSEYALPLVRRLLAESGMTLAQCDAFAFGAGPGRFSGLRMACGIVQAFAFALERPGVAVNSLAAIAENNYGNTAAHAEVALPAQRGHVYVAHCRRTVTWRSARPRLLALENYVPAARTRRLCGQAFVEYPQLLDSPRADFCDRAPQADAAAVGTIAAAMFAAGETLAAVACQPLYVRRHVAQTMAERAGGKNKPPPPQTMPGTAP